MAREVRSYADDRGGLHATAEAAVLADIAVVIGRVGGDSGMTAGLAKLIVEKRAEIERAFLELDALSVDDRSGQ